MNIQPLPYHQLPMALLLEADPSEAKVSGYIDKSLCFAAEDQGDIVGVAAVLPITDIEYELMNIAVSPERQGENIGRQLLDYVIEATRKAGAEKLVLGTGTFGYQLTFYQRAGFRVYGVERDFFLRHYDEPLFEQGIQHKDMLRLELVFS